ncbi:MAG: hypothetical protein LBL46_03015 [Rickettsiales bacterium]|nr:hypothetical protein [Rickettsiales bacterium]
MSDMGFTSEEIERLFGRGTDAKNLKHGGEPVSAAELAGARANAEKTAYIYDYRLYPPEVYRQMFNSDRAVLEDPREPDEQDFIKSGEIVGGLRFDGDDGIGPREAEPDWEEIQIAKKKAYDAVWDARAKLLGNAVYLARRVEYLERINGIQIDVAGLKRACNIK